MRTYLNTLLHRKRGEYGPLWLFELDAETWAIVWSGWLENEDLCYAILSEDAHLFNREWGSDGRRPNPTYKTKDVALEEVVRLLHAMKADLYPEDAEHKKYALYISVAKHDLHQSPLDQVQERGPAQRPSAQASTGVSEGAEVAADALFAVETTSAPTFLSQAVTQLAGQTIEAGKPWEEYRGTPTAINFKPLDDAHAKMEWVCENVPKMSRMRLVREAVDMFCDQLIEKHYQK